MNPAKKFMLITLGEELLLGLTRNGHLTYIGQQLREHGVTLHSNYTISDESKDIDEQFRYCWERADVVITTGGLGPTVDDRTKEVVASLLNEPLVFDEAILDTIKARFQQYGKTMTDNNRKQAYRPQSAEVLENPNGTAPGLWLEKGGKILIMLPGPPRELQPMFESIVLPRLLDIGYVEKEERYLQLRTVGIGESALETLLQPLLEKYEQVTVAYCAHPGSVDFRISFPNGDGRDEDLLNLAQECKDLLGEDFLCVGNETLEAVVFQMLRNRGKSLATAESCTGGLIATKFTDIPGSSECFRGGIVSYSVDAKSDLLEVPEDMIQQHTPVSDEVAIAMAAGAAEKFEADYALSATGYAGPSGGTTEDPVGTAYIGLHSPRGIWSKRLFFKGTRAVIKERVAQAAFDFLRREIIAGNSLDPLPNQELRSESSQILRSLS